METALGTAGIRFSSVDLLQEANYEDTFSIMMELLTCIKIVANVRNTNEILVLMEFMNGIRKVSIKHIVVKIQKGGESTLNTTLLEQISINYDVNIHGRNAG